MKGICAIIAAIVLAACIPRPALAPAAETTAFYARAETRNAYFYSSKSQSSALFAVPYTYCVQVLSEDGEWYYVKYADDYGIYRAIYGYCLKNTLSAVDGTPSPVYLYKEVTVTYTADMSGGSLPVLSELIMSAAFYGTFYSGPTAYSYVLCNGSFGYIEGANDDYEIIDYTGESDGGADETESADASPNGKIIAAAAIGAIAVVSVLLLLFTGKRKNFAE